MILLPNVNMWEARQTLDDIRHRVGQLSFEGTNRKTTISVGFVLLDPESYLTDREAEERANRAKRFAKDSGRNRVASYRGELFRDEDLYIIAGMDGT